MYITIALQIALSTEKSNRHTVAIEQSSSAFLLNELKRPSKEFIVQPTWSRCITFRQPLVFGVPSLIFIHSCGKFAPLQLLIVHLFSSCSTRKFFFPPVPCCCQPTNGGHRVSLCGTQARH